MASGIHCFKVVLVGEYGVGKSSIFHRFRNSEFVPGVNEVRSGGNKSCLGLDNYSRVFYEDNRTVRIELWDTAGLERFSTLPSNYYFKAAAVIACFSYNSKESFNAVAQQHIFDAIDHSRTAAIFVCGNMADKTKMTDGEDIGDCVRHEDCVTLMTQFDDIITRIFTVSCKTGEGVEEMFVEIAKTLLRRADSNEHAARILLANSDTDLGVPRDVGKKPGCC